LKQLGGAQLLPLELLPLDGAGLQGGEQRSPAWDPFGATKLTASRPTRNQVRLMAAFP